MIIENKEKYISFIILKKLIKNIDEIIYKIKKYNKIIITLIIK